MPILCRSPLASCFFEDGNGKHIRVYYQKENGDIMESFYDDGSGWSTRGNDPVVIKDAMINSPIACCVWDSGVQIRVYYMDKNMKLCEKMYTGGSGWKDGALNSKSVSPAHFSKLACTTFDMNKDRHIRVYYQNSSLKMSEMVYRSQSWTDGPAKLPVCTPGSSFACFNVPDQPANLWVYCQKQDLTLCEMLYNNKQGGDWYEGGYKPTGLYRPGCAISVAAWDNVQVRVFNVNNKNEIVYTTYDGQKWTGTNRLTQCITDCEVPCVQWGKGGASDLRLYYQYPNEEIQEVCFSGGKWVPGATVPIVA